jgi:hypothetical protein
VVLDQPLGRQMALIQRALPDRRRVAVLPGPQTRLQLGALEQELRSKQVALLPFAAPWLHLSYGLFYTRKRPLSRVAQLFMTQLRQVEVIVQTREQRALARLEGKTRPRRATSRRKTRTRADSGAAMPTGDGTASAPTPRRRARKSQ